MISKTYSIKTNGKGFYELSLQLEDFAGLISNKSGLLNIFAPHTSASVVVTENYDPDVKLDLLDALENFAPESENYRHSLEGPDDMPAHVKNALLGCSVNVPVYSGKVLLGRWQGIYLVEHKKTPQIRKVIFSLI